MEWRDRRGWERWGRWVARGGLGAVRLLGAAGSRPGTPGWWGRKTGGSGTAALGGIGMGRLGAFSLAGCQGWLGSVGVEHGAGSRPGTPGWRRKRKTGGSETAPLRKIRPGWRDGGGCCIRGCGSARASGGLRPGRFDRLRTGSPRTVSRVALTGRGRFETGPYARLRRNGGIGGVWSAGGGGLPGMAWVRSGCWVALGPGPIRQAQGRLDAGMAGEEDGRVGVGCWEGWFDTTPSTGSGQALRGLRVGSPRTVGWAGGLLPGRGRLETGPYARAGRGQGIWREKRSRDPSGDLGMTGGGAGVAGVGAVSGGVVRHGPSKDYGPACHERLGGLGVCCPEEAG